MRTYLLCISVFRVGSGPRMKMASYKSALTPHPVVYSTDRSKAVVPVLVLLFVALLFILRGDLFYVLPCVILFLCFSVLLAFAITSLGEERANLSVFWTFVRFVLVWICRVPLPLAVWEWLRFVIVAFPGLFPYLFFTLCCFVVYSTRVFVLCLTLCYFLLTFFSPFRVAITSLVEEKTNLSAFRTFVRFVLVRFCRFSLPLGVWEGLRFVIVAFPEHFSYLFSSVSIINLLGAANTNMF